jgi:hypothetical protein
VDCVCFFGKEMSNVLDLYVTNCILLFFLFFQKVAFTVSSGSKELKVMTNRLFFRRIEIEEQFALKM